MTEALPWDERATMLSINPDCATRDDVARLASELMEMRIALNDMVCEHCSVIELRLHPSGIGTIVYPTNEVSSVAIVGGLSASRIAANMRAIRVLSDHGFLTLKLDYGVVVVASTLPDKKGETMIDIVKLESVVGLVKRNPTDFNLGELAREMRVAGMIVIGPRTAPPGVFTYFKRDVELFPRCEKLSDSNVRNFRIWNTDNEREQIAQETVDLNGAFALADICDEIVRRRKPVKDTGLGGGITDRKDMPESIESRLIRMEGYLIRIGKATVQGW